MSSVSVLPIKAFNDNYIWCLAGQGNCVVVDPGDAAPVINHCKVNNLTLTDILITHHHWDHTNGLTELLNAFPHINIYGPKNDKIAHITHYLTEGDSIELANLGVSFQVIEVPGHTLDHIAYHGETGLFCGDTLFSAGCGRLFEGSPKQMFNSLQKLTALPAQTPVYCTHEYTLANIKFAEQVEPNNKDLLNYKGWAESQRIELKPTLPSTIAQQLAINPFLRVEQADVKQSAETYRGNVLSSPDETFAALRNWKDNF
ncbi:MAG: hydroxyacylglutathione hydrolase [Paraglaciecola sp.]|jgi:hydroxyacylglutathione hydrolase